mmetsp:Transcript_113345/g.331291  ORF Transcript_113345/g.331291 Transcript_113345/m.331291 type:complete len:332 (-) Transcript_113345:478-1473(-)
MLAQLWRRVSRATYGAEYEGALPDSEVYALCHAMAHSLPVQYASVGFKDMFETSPFKELAESKSLLGSPVVTTAIASSTGLSFADSSAALHWLESNLASVSEKVATRRQLWKPSFAWVVRVKKSGEPIVCKVIVTLQWHPKLGWNCVRAIYEDVSQQVSMHKLLGEVAAGKGFAMIRLLEEEAAGLLHSRGALLSIPSPSPKEDAFAEGRCTRVLRDALHGYPGGPQTFELGGGKLMQIINRCPAQSLSCTSRGAELDKRCPSETPKSSNLPGVGNLGGDLADDASPASMYSCIDEVGVDECSFTDVASTWNEATVRPQSPVPGSLAKRSG